MSNTILVYVAENLVLSTQKKGLSREILYIFGENLSCKGFVFIFHILKRNDYYE